MEAHKHQPLGRVLIIEDEHAMRLALHDCLVAEGYRVLLSENGEDGLAKALSENPDLIVLDIMMPKLDGYAVARAVRQANRKTPILMLTARGQVADRVAGLDAGGDDYLIKPFSTEELLARIRSLLRRSHREIRRSLKISTGDLQINLQDQRIIRAGREIHLTQKEYAMLELLIASAPEPVTRERFLDAVWGYTQFPTTRTVDNHIVLLRQKLEADPDHPVLIKTVHGAGYRFELPAEFANA
jgi:two-component system alkaline phosphatase synthesis response regulator PhoP